MEERSESKMETAVRMVSQYLENEGYELIGATNQDGDNPRYILASEPGNKTAHVLTEVRLADGSPATEEECREIAKHARMWIDKHPEVTSIRGDAVHVELVREHTAKTSFQRGIIAWKKR